MHNSWEIIRISPAHSPLRPTAHHVTVLPYINHSVHVTEGFDTSSLPESKKTLRPSVGLSSDLTPELGLLGSVTILCGFSSFTHIFPFFVFSCFR
ncbi:hypothetical protein BHE74_00011238 [Ensete ventricosum]|uniref:Uncharacterized protein n=1 Tax=Ensete ventricosum TaxID=4639 RepID=A0A445MCX4_ENSVE|nr:hypothetical protein BHE74_00011238 [Ensete ventricosum]RZR72073.1 hypothetical protein BHM03_00010231 [Ensete ventricosum]